MATRRRARFQTWWAPMAMDAPEGIDGTQAAPHLKFRRPITKDRLAILKIKGRLDRVAASLEQDATNTDLLQEFEAINFEFLEVMGARVEIGGQWEHYAEGAIEHGGSFAELCQCMAEEDQAEFLGLLRPQGQVTESEKNP